MGDLDDEVLNDFQENNEWDACFNAIEEWDEEQNLIAKSNATDEEAPRPEYLQVLHRCFGHKSFRPMQWKIISSIINDRRDNCAIMATGYGKSLCFQYPSVYVGGVTLVISPLISLMEDQVLSMQMSNISACLLGSAQENKRQVLDDILENKYSLVYLTPELCCSDYGQYVLQSIDAKVSIVLIAIDEAHCVSSWGHDFRYQYRQLWKLRDVLPNVPILAVTATATPRVRSDIVSCLKLRNPQVLCSGFDRPNLQFSVFLKGSNGIVTDLRKVMIEKNGCLSFPGSTIIYCITRKQTEDVAGLLKKNGIKCLAYHAGMSVKARKEAHEKFAKDKVKTIIATIAFGMGIDKPDVRNVVHYGASKDIESYYQEVGRAGRDGQPSNCITFYNNLDFDLHQTIREMGGINQTNRDRQQSMEKIMLQYLETRDCRRQFILNHFEGSVTPKKPKPKCCDNCTRKLRDVSDCNKYEGLNEKGLYDFTSDAHIFLTAVEAMGGKFGFGKYILFIRGSKSVEIRENLQRHPAYGRGKNKSLDWWKAIARLMEREGYLKKLVHKSHKKSVYNTYSVSDKAGIFLQNMKNDVKNIKIMLSPSPDIYNLLELKSQAISPGETSCKAAVLPSTSRKSLKLSKPPLKLMSFQSMTSSNDSDNQSENSENDFEKEERMKVYRLLMNKRADLASAVDCMPYMVASNEALMKMAQMKPLTIEELRKCQLERFTEAKISRFGEEFIKTIRTICKLDPAKIEANVKRSIQDILAETPVPGCKIGATAEASYSMYKSGLTVQEISTKRGVIAATVLSHLVDGIKAGYPIKLIDLNVTDEMRDSIIDVIRKPPINSDMSALTPIKNVCNEEISFNDIKVVIAYLQVRDHLAKLNVAYEDFETPMAGFVESQNHTVISESHNHTVTSESQSTHNANPSPSLLSGSRQNTANKIKLGSLISSNRYEKRDADGDFADGLVLDSSSVNPPKKKQKLKLSNPSRTSERNSDLDFLDSPPRSTHKLSSQRKKREELIIFDSPPKRRTLSPQKDDINLEKSLEDDFFDDIILDDVDKAVSLSQNTVNKSNSETGYKSRDFKEQYSKNENEQEKLSTSSSANSSIASQQNRFKKFQFKSKVPQSVVESTKQLFLSQPIQPVNK